MSEIDTAALRRIAERSEAAAPLGWSYRSQIYDDWVYVRSARGSVVAVSRLDRERAEELADEIEAEAICLNTRDYSRWPLVKVGDHDLVVSALRLLAQTTGRVVCMNCGSSPPIGVYRCDCADRDPPMEPRFAAELASTTDEGSALRENASLRALLKEAGEVLAWTKAATVALEAYERDWGEPLDDNHEIGRFDESRGSPSFRLRVAHLRTARALAARIEETLGHG